MRAGLSAGIAAVCTVCATPVLAAPDVTAARYTMPTTRYAHGILGDAIEFGALQIETATQVVTVTLPEEAVFEDVAPRLIDIDLDGFSEVLVVESTQTGGARIAIYDGTGAVIAATPHIGRPNRWYAPVGAADLDGDGRVEVAFIDRPHLAKTLRIWRYDDGVFAEVAFLPGVTNHRIGEEDIAGGIRDCGSGPEMIVATADWQRLVAIQFADGFEVTDAGVHNGRDSFANVMACNGS